MAEELSTDALYDLTSLSYRLAVSPSGDRTAFVAVESDPDEDERRAYPLDPAGGPRVDHGRALGVYHVGRHEPGRPEQFRVDRVDVRTPRDLLGHTGPVGPPGS